MALESIEGQPIPVGSVVACSLTSGLIIYSSTISRGMTGFSERSQIAQRRIVVRYTAISVAD